MKKSYSANKLASAIFITLLLLYFMVKTSSPKIIFVPFLICSITMAGKHLALLLGKNKFAVIFSKLFSVGFLLFLFGTLIVAAFICVRDKNYTVLLFSTPFWLAGIYLTKKRLINNRSKKTAPSPLPVGIVIISSTLVLIALAAGVMLLIQGFKTSDAGMIFAGGFFTLVAFTFVLGALTVKGIFDNCKVDILGLYVGVVITVIGAGIIAMIYQKGAGLWITIPALMIVAGVLQVVKCFRKNNNNER